LGGARGRRIDLKDRERIVKLIQYACGSGAQKAKACELLGISIRTFQRWKENKIGVKEDQRKCGKHNPANKLSEEERRAILDICNKSEYQSLPPSQIVPSLADHGIYIASESTIYRILKEEKQLHHRGKSKPKTVKKPEPFTATGPNQVWSWDYSDDKVIPILY